MIYVSDLAPLAVLSETTEPGTLAVISMIEGPSYRSLGATMAIMPDGTNIGTLSSGCIESDLVHHAEEARETGKPITVRYGIGSPFLDIQLPCGGTLEVTLIHAPDQKILREVAQRTSQRVSCTLNINCKTGALSISDTGNTGMENDIFSIGILPELRFIVFGKGPEALTFASLTQTSSFENILLSPDKQMCEQAEKSGCQTQHLIKPEFPSNLSIDERTAILLFFHDHDWEPPILKDVLSSSAFFIGAQGSKRARQALIYELEAMGVTKSELANLRGSIGLIPSARDSRTLAISVLAEVLDASREA